MLQRPEIQIDLEFKKKKRKKKALSSVNLPNLSTATKCSDADGVSLSQALQTLGGEV